MPELPEVTTTVNGLQKVLPGLSFVDVWTDIAKENPIKQFQNTIKDEKFYKKFKKEIIGAKVKNVERRAKNILINLNPKPDTSGRASAKTILIHLKMTGHLLYGNYVFNKKENKWTPHEKEHPAFHDPYNRFIHIVFTLSNGKHLAFCDARKFGKVTLIDTDTLYDTKHLKGVGPEPLDKSFTFSVFKDRIMRKPNGNIKTVLMDQTNIAGIGNIYSDEALWLADIHPESKPKAIPLPDMKNLYKSVQTVLKKGIDFGGDSTSDYRDINGVRGEFQSHHNVYRRAREVCGKKKSNNGKTNCNGVILRKVINGRSAHFCSVHQILFK